MREIIAAVDAGDLNEILKRMFTDRDGVPELRSGFRRENSAWDYKRGLPGLQANKEVAWADVAASVLALHNAAGGLLIFGIDDTTYTFVGTRDYVDGKRFNDKIRRYTGDTIWADFSREYIQGDQRFLGIALVPGRTLVPIRLQADAPMDASGRRLFSAGDLCVRENDERRIYRGSDADQYLASNRLPSPDARFSVREPQYRILRPDWEVFVDRPELCERVSDGLRDERTYVTTLTGIGGIGKTALATWGVLTAYKRGDFDYIISISAKDRELGERGIRPVDSALTSYDGLLNEILDVTGFSDCIPQSTGDRENAVASILAGTRALLYVDNLETIVDDGRIVRFLESIPKPVKAITTSRVATVRTAAYPIAVGPLTAAEAAKLFDQTCRRRGRDMLRNASSAEKERIVSGCAYVPLAIEWLIGNARDVGAALQLAEDIVGSRRRDDELLEFCFRRVYDRLTAEQQLLLRALALDQQPQVVEALSAACQLSIESVDASLVALQDCALAERLWDAKRRDFAYKLITITRKFAYRELRRHEGTEAKLRARLGEWYEGRDVADHEREYVQAIRRGAQDPEASLVDAAIARRRAGRLDESEDLFVRAIERSPRSWKARREYAELLRDHKNTGAALQQYEIAAKYAPAHGSDRALIYREWGMLLRTSGAADAHERALESFAVAIKETPNDVVLNHAYASSLLAKGRFRPAAALLQNLIGAKSPETRARTYPLLLECYEKLGEIVKAAELKQQIEGDTEARAANVGSHRTIETSARPFVPQRRRRGR